MFQNINENTIDSRNYKEVRNERKRIDILTDVFSLKNIPIYIISLMISMVGITGELSPFSISILGACIVNSIPLLGVVLFSCIGNCISFGIGGLLQYILTALVLIVTMFIIKPISNEEEENENVKLSKNIFISTLIIGLAQIGLSGFTVYDILSIISFAIIAVV